MKNLSEKALLVNIIISQWTARAYDEEVSMQVERDHSTINAGHYTKILIDEAALKEPQKAARAARKFYYKQTLPWTDNGDRILPATNYFQFMKEFNLHKSTFESAVNGFVREYPSLKSEAKYRLNGMFKEEDYPDALAVHKKFGIKMGMLPINNIEDFRLQVNAQEVQHLRAQMEQEITFRVQEANKSLWSRIKDTIGRVVDRFSQEDAVFRNSLIDNVKELIDLIPRLNFTDDYELDEIAEEMKSLVVNPDEIREDSSLRKQKAKEAQAIFDRASEFFD